MKTILRVLGYGFLIVVVVGCRKPVDLPSTARNPDQLGSGEPYVGEGFALVIPPGWRNITDLAFGNRKLYLNGDGIGPPAIDETGAPLQIGMTVEMWANTTDSLEKGLEDLISNAKRNRRLEFVGEAKVDSYRLTDGTNAALLTMGFIKEGRRRSLQMKLLAKDSDSNGWIVSAFLVGGKDSTIPTADSTVAKLLRAHVTSFCFDPARLATPKSADKGSQIE